MLEGVAFGLRDSFELMRTAGLAAIRQVRISGGGARSLLWQQILADVLGTELVTVNTTEGAAYGASLLAGVGAGLWADVPAACEAAIRVTGHVTPTSGQDVLAWYEALYSEYRELYPALKPRFERLALANE